MDQSPSKDFAGQTLTIAPHLWFGTTEEIEIEFGALITVLGFLVCVMVVANVGWWCAQHVEVGRRNRHRLEQKQMRIRSEIDRASEQQKNGLPTEYGGWSGYRKFVVERIRLEAEQTSSIYLRPEDERPLPPFRPGQYLTFRWNIPGSSKPLVRCYTISDSPNRRVYRITVKAGHSAKKSSGHFQPSVSRYITNQLAEGDIVDIKSPSGSFFLDTDNEGPVVLLAAGIGITPMISMINTLTEEKSKRLVLLVYTVKNSDGHAFQNHLKQLEVENRNLQVVTCYSDPLPGDTLGQEFNYQGHANVRLLQQLLPNAAMDFYLCGPPSFMECCHQELVAWGVTSERLHFEAFGPASIQRTSSESRSTHQFEPAPASVTVEFCRSEKTIAWSDDCNNLLDLAEANGIELESGCRTGNCGTCELNVILGEVAHEGRADVLSGKCLACIAIPQSHLKIEA